MLGRMRAKFRFWMTAFTICVCCCLLFNVLLLETYFQTQATTSRAHSGNPVLSSHVLCVLVPYRDRFEELLVFVPHLYAFLTAQNITHHILVINQMDRYRFNRASLINVGYNEAVTLGCDYLCMHDVDLLPLNPELSYAMPEQGPLHLSSRDYHPRYNYTKFIGGIMLLRMSDFLLINGMSNKYWGWGMEDDELFLRFRDAQLLIQRPRNLSTNRTNTFRHVHSRHRWRDDRKLFDQRNMTRYRDRMTGLDTVQYSILGRTPLSMGADGARCLVLNVQLHCDIARTPWCLDVHNFTTLTPATTTIRVA